MTTSPLSREECCKIVKRRLQRDDFELKWFGVAPHSTDFKGYMGDHLKLRVSVSLREKGNECATTTELQFFVKAVPTDDAYRRSLALSNFAYQKEVLFYGDLLQDVQKHLRCPDLESSTYLGTVCRCYYFRPDLLVLEDLALAGFRVLDSVEPLDVHQCECVLRAMARLHGASLVLEERGGRRLADVYPLLLEETLFRRQPDSPIYVAHNESRRMTHLLLDLIPRFAPGTPHNEELHSLLDTVMESVYEVMQPSDRYRDVLCHRDLWINNMLFAEDGRREVSVRLVDFQTLRLEPPAHDVLTFLHLCTMRDLRRTHGRRLLEHYHQALAGVLGQHDLDVDSVLPLQVFLQSCEEAKAIAVILAVYILQVTMLPIQQDADLKSRILERTDQVNSAYQCHERFRTRITETMEELVETCLLPRLQNQQSGPSTMS